MRRQLVVALVSLGLGTSAFAGGDKKQKSEEQSNQQVQQQQQTGTGGAGMQQPDMSKNGPWTRKPTDESKSKREIQSLFKNDEEAWKKGDFDAALAHVDFPVFMVTDDSKGKPHAETWSREQWTKMMKPMAQQMPKDMEVSHDYSINVLSDSLATYADSFTMKTGGMSYKGKSSGVLVKKDGEWKWKSLIEPGWGSMATQGVGGAGSEGGDQNDSQAQPPEQQKSEE